MKAAISSTLASLFCLFAAIDLVAAETLMNEPGWERSRAMQSIDREAARATLKPLYELARAGDNAKLLDALSAITLDAGIEAPMQDYLVYRFTLGLSDMDANAVNATVIGFLANYPARTLVAHDDRPGMGVPLFNVRAAAHGINNSWDRQMGAAVAESLVGESPDRFITSYLQATPAGRRGFIDTLEFASSEQLEKLGASALPRITEHPELTLVAAQVAINSGNLELLQTTVTLGGGPDIARVLKTASLNLNTAEAAELLEYTLQLDSASKAALAIAQLAPSRLDDTAVREMMFNTLSDRELGAAAALVLGVSDDPAIKTRLSEIAQGHDGLKAQRAALAISTAEMAGRTEQ